MKKHVNGHVYDTKHATLVGVIHDNSISTAVFKTKSGEFFVLKYAGGDPKNPQLGAIGASTRAEAETIAARPGFTWEAPDAFALSKTTRTSVELTERDRDLLRKLCRVDLQGNPRTKRIGMGAAIGELLDLAQQATGFGATGGLDAVAGFDDHTSDTSGTSDASKADER